MSIESRSLTAPRRVLWGISSVGLGHVRRSVTVARKVKALMNGSVQIDWVCAEPGLGYLASVGENALPVSEKLESMSSSMERGAEKGRIQDIGKVARLTAGAGKRNYMKIRPILGNYDALIQDEFVETIYSSLWDKNSPLPQRKVVITDYVRLESTSRNPVSKLVLWRANKLLKSAFSKQTLLIFADSEDALPKDKKVKSWAAEHFHVLGPIIDSVPESKDKLRKILNLIGKDRIAVFSIGGTSIGRGLASFVLENARSLSEALGAQLVILLGPRLGASEFQASDRVTVVPFTPDAPKYFKLADCVVTQAGASSLNEVASLGVPCVCIPIENHWEQRQNAMRFSAKFGFEVLEYKDLSVALISRAIESATSKSYTPLSSMAADQAANLIAGVIR